MLVENLTAERELLVEEPRLGERDAEFRTLGTGAQAHGEPLATAGEIPWIEEIEVRLLEGDEADDAIDGAEPDTDADGAGGLFLHEDIHIPVAGTAGGSGGLDVAEILEVVQAGLGGVELDGIELIARLERDFPADDLVLGLGVTGDVDAADPEASALGDAVGDADPIRSGIPDVGSDKGVGITAGPVEAADRGDVRTHFLGGISGIPREC